jgi:hypothetical protein
MAVILDLPGPESLALGLELCRLGFFPALLLNACPAPELIGESRDEVVPVTPLLPALIQGVDQIKAAALAPDAPPAFLLDANRLGLDKPIGPGSFDNRWVVFPTDFPSALFLFRQGIDRVQIVHRDPLAQDLLDVLRTWQRGGIALLHRDVAASPALLTLRVRSTWWLQLSLVARRWWAFVTLRRNPRGGFGRFVPEAGSSVG